MGWGDGGLRVNFYRNAFLHQILIDITYQVSALISHEYSIIPFIFVLQQLFFTDFKINKNLKKIISITKTNFSEPKMLPVAVTDLSLLISELPMVTVLISFKIRLSEVNQQ